MNISPEIALLASGVTGGLLLASFAALKINSTVDKVVPLVQDRLEKFLETKAGEIIEAIVKSYTDDGKFDGAELMDIAQKFKAAVGKESS